MVWISKEDFTSDLMNMDAGDFYRRAIASNQAYVFSRDDDGPGAFEIYDAFKEQVGSHFAVSLHNVCLIGSGKTGYSLNPDNNFKLYNSSSDIDVVIVSPSEFDRLWDVYLQLHYNDTEFKPSEVRREVFRQYISFTHLPPKSADLRSMEKRLGPLRRDLETKFYITSEINFRIYRNWDAVKLYHVSGINKLKSKLEQAIA